ncbi:MAG: hypothetical protein JWM47_583 [Acidimicrobiales bacterium]|nr:hypothetical protein [Acidimicrobiales bacterium]
MLSRLARQRVRRWLVTGAVAITAGCGGPADTGLSDRLVEAERRARAIEPTPCDALAPAALESLLGTPVPAGKGPSTLIFYRYCDWTAPGGAQAEARLTEEVSVAEGHFVRPDRKDLYLGPGIKAVLLHDPLFLEAEAGSSVVLEAHGVVAFLQYGDDTVPPGTDEVLVEAARALAPRLSR